MSQKNDYLHSYYGESGNYLKDHDSFLKSANIEKDALFLIKVLELQSDDAVLDIACGQGRHTTALAQMGYSVDGVDFSAYLLDIAKKTAENLKDAYIPQYFMSDITSLKLEKKYDKAYWFFSDLANIDAEKAVTSICASIADQGIILIDVDNIFRIINNILKNPNSPFSFDAKNLELIDSENNLRVPYPVFPIWRQWFENSKSTIVEAYGDYDFSEYSINSRRLILKVKKTA